MKRKKRAAKRNQQPEGRWGKLPALPVDLALHQEAGRGLDIKTLAEFVEEEWASLVRSEKPYVQRWLFGEWLQTIWNDSGARRS